MEFNSDLFAQKCMRHPDLSCAFSGEPENADDKSACQPCTKTALCKSCMHIPLTVNAHIRKRKGSDVGVEPNSTKCIDVEVNSHNNQRRRTTRHGFECERLAQQRPNPTRCKRSEEVCDIRLQVNQEIVVIKVNGQRTHRTGGHAHAIDISMNFSLFVVVFACLYYLYFNLYIAGLRS